MFKRIGRPLALVAALGFGAAHTAGAAPYTHFDPAETRIAFGYSQMNVKMDGSFAQARATTFRFDPAQPENAKVALDIVLASVDAGYDEANDELKKPEWLALANHPLATFESDQVASLGDGRYEVTGKLSIKGQTRDIVAPFSFSENDGAGIFEGRFTFQRADFGIGEGAWKDFSIVANDIEVSFRVVARP